MIIRIARGRFSSENGEAIRLGLRESEASLRPAVSALPGLIRYYVGIDLASGAMTNTSVWDGIEHASAMSTVAALRVLRPRFAALGLEYEPVTNHELVWTHP